MRTSSHARRRCLPPGRFLRRRIRSTFLGRSPAIFPLDMLPYQSNTSLPGDMHRFFAMQQLVDQYGAGHIPTEEWEALNAWNSES